jgi:hypothetical protein
MPEYITIKVWAETRKRLKLLAAILGQTMAAVLDTLVSAALEQHRADKP